MPHDKRKTAARALAAESGLSYTAARRALAGQQGTASRLMIGTTPDPDPAPVWGCR